MFRTTRSLVGKVWAERGGAREADRARAARMASGRRIFMGTLRRRGKGRTGPFLKLPPRGGGPQGHFPRHSSRRKPPAVPETGDELDLGALLAPVLFLSPRQNR